MKIKVIKVEESTHKRLASLGIITDTFDDIIVRLLDFYDKNQKVKKE